MHKILYIFLLSFWVTALCGCSAFVDARREAGQIEPVGQSRVERVAICYNPIVQNDAELEVMAKEACARKKATFDGRKYFNCALFAPNTVFYKCD